jgi:hypothetical protein
MLAGEIINCYRPQMLSLSGFPFWPLHFVMPTLPTALKSAAGRVVFAILDACSDQSSRQYFTLLSEALESALAKSLIALAIIMGGPQFTNAKLSTDT